MAGKQVTVDVEAGEVLKRDLPGHEGAVAKQTARLLDLGRRGYSVAGVLDGGEGWAKHEWIEGRSLRDHSWLSPRQRACLSALMGRMISDGLYIGDLNPRNLIWSPRRGDWIIIDCGAARHKSASSIRRRLRRKWGRHYEGS